MRFVTIGLVFSIPIALTIWNVLAIKHFLMYKQEKKYDKSTKIIALCVGAFYLMAYIGLSEITFSNWDISLYNSQKHSMLAPDNALSIAVILMVALLGYVLIRFVRVEKQSPIASALGISGIYLGIGIFVLWCIQTSNDFVLMIYPANCIFIFLKAIYIFVYQKSKRIQDEDTPMKYKKLSNIVNKATNLPWIALILVIPLLGVLIAILLLFGQEPSSVIKAWTETADWTLSQKIGPPNVQYDEHYLCTVAAGGHRKIVKPTRTGIRHGHQVLVNRQLSIANAFEQVLQEKMPKIHKVIRTTYNNIGYPISKHIHSKLLADIIYLLMKPLEWFFLIVLYAVDVNPENRIAVQYPHSPIPSTGSIGV